MPYSALYLAGSVAALLTYLTPAAHPVSTMPASISAEAPQVMVNRARKGDKLTPRPVELVPAAAPRQRLDGCEPSFSPVAAPSLSHHTGRCIT